MASPATKVDYSIIQPPPDLAPYVKFFWSLKSLPNHGDYYIFRTMASGYPLIFVHYEGNLQEAETNGYRGPVSRSGIYGPAKQTRRFRFSGDFGVFGACLFPFAIPALFRMPATELVDEFISLSDWMKEDLGALEDKMSASTSDRQRAAILSNLLRLRLREPERIHHAVNGVIQSNGKVDIPSLADDHCYSRRVFERKFKESTGFSPRSYSNVIRFQSSFGGLTSQQSSLTEIAYQCGYYDQSHFTNEFTRLSGFNPKQFTTPVPSQDPLWLDFVAFFQFLSWCPPVLCGIRK